MNSNVFNDRNYRKLHQASKLLVLPDFVKSAPAEEEQNFDKIASDVFADTAQRKYPLDTKSNTWLSRHYFGIDKEAYDKGRAKVVDQKIKDAVKFWGVDDAVAVPVQEKEAYEIPLTHNGQTVHTVRIESKEHFKQAAEEVCNSFEKLAYCNRREYARGLYLAPASFKADLTEDQSEYIEKAAGFGMCDRHRVGQSILSRVCLLTNRPAYSDKLTEVGTNLPDLLTPALLDKVANILDNIDRDCNFVRFYGKGGMNAPELELFHVTEKTASLVQEEAIALTNGSVIHKTAILNDDKGVIDQFFQNYYGEIPYGDDVQEKIAVIESLPAPEATALQKLTGLK